MISQRKPKPNFIKIVIYVTSKVIRKLIASGKINMKVKKDLKKTKQI